MKKTTNTKVESDKTNPPINNHIRIEDLQHRNNLYYKTKSTQGPLAGLYSTFKNSVGASVGIVSSLSLAAAAAFTGEPSGVLPAVMGAFIFSLGLKSGEEVEIEVKIPDGEGDLDKAEKNIDELLEQSPSKIQQVSTNNIKK